MLGEKTAPSGSMFLGRQVDDAITLYYRHILDHGEHLSLDQVKDAFWDGWKAAAEAEREQLGIAWETDLREDSAFKLGLDAVELTFSRADPAPRRARRRPAKGRVHARARARVERALLPRPRDPAAADAGALLPAVVDYKVKTTPLTQYKADHDFQPAVYLAGRWLEGDPAAQFCFAQIAKPGICRFRHIPGYVAQGTMSRASGMSPGGGDRAVGLDIRWFRGSRGMQQRVGCAIASGFGVQRGGAVERALLERHVGVDVLVGRVERLVAEP